MGIQSRDYMKRPPDDDDHASSTPDAKLEAFFSSFLHKHPRFFLYVGVAIAILAIAAVIIIKLA